MGVAFDGFPLPAFLAVMNSHRIIGSAHSGKQYLVEALGFAARGKVKAMIEVFPKERAAEGDERTKSRLGRTRGRPEEGVIAERLPTRWITSD